MYIYSIYIYTYTRAGMAWGMDQNYGTQVNNDLVTPVSKWMFIFSFQLSDRYWPTSILIPVHLCMVKANYHRKHRFGKTCSSKSLRMCLAFSALFRQEYSWAGFITQISTWQFVSLKTYIKLLISDYLITIWLFNIAMEGSTMLLIAKPSISMSHLYHMAMLVITRG